VFYGFLLSAMIETLQFILGTGVSELDDLILNTFGVWIGAKIQNYRKNNEIKGIAE
jgi:glycopeptide antibiotics resistance protein